MKKIDKLLIKTYLGPFILTTAIVVFILLMRFLVNYLNDFLGKDLGIALFSKLFFYFSLISVPDALQLSVLLASLMAFGNLGEKFELTALKASGISLYRLLQPLFFLVLFIAICSGFYNNYVNPWASLKGYTMLYDVQNAKSTFNIQPGIFYKQIPGYRIKVQEKKPNGILKKIMIYDHDQKGNKSLILADSGKMYTMYNNNYLIFELFNGKSYNEVNMQNTNDTQFSKYGFKKNKIVFSLESFRKAKTDEERFKYHEFMKTMPELKTKVDSLKKNVVKSLAFQTNIYKNQKEIYFKKIPMLDTLKNKKEIKAGKWIYEKLKNIKGIEQKAFIEQSAIQELNMLKANVESDKINIDNSLKEVYRADLEWWHKITKAFSCFVMFFIGASLGSIIKKGGFGMPVLISISFFILLYVLTQLGDKYAKEGIINVVVGAWIPNFVLLIIAIIFMSKASKDRQIFENEKITMAFEKIKSFFIKEKPENYS